MNQILAISPKDEYAIVEPGLINAELNASLRQHGLWFVPDPVSKNISTVGGNIATNAGGLVCTKYGVTREAVLALDVVLPDGTLPLDTSNSPASIFDPDCPSRVIFQRAGDKWASLVIQLLAVGPVRFH
jgi:FAD/FMN-containing dehydrogenase